MQAPSATTRALILALCLFAGTLPLGAQGGPQEPSGRDQFFPPVTLLELSIEQMLARDPAPPTKLDFGLTGLSIDEMLLPSGTSGFFRSLELSASSIDQSNRIFVGVTDEVPDGFIIDPTNKIEEYKLTVSPGSWHRSAADHLAAYTLVSDASVAPLIDLGTDPLLSEKFTRAKDPVDKLQFLAWSKKGGLGKRLASSVSLEIATKERSKLASNVEIPVEILERDRNIQTYSVEFSPDKLVIFPGDLASAYAALDKHTALQVSNKSGLDDKSCVGNAKGNPVRCLALLSGIKVRGRWLAALLPTLTAKTVDEFDFYSNEGIFSRSPLLEDSIETYSATWDLGASLDVAKHRREAVKAVVLHQKLVERDQRRAQGLAITVPGCICARLNQLYHYRMAATYNDGKQKSAAATWKATWKDGTGKERKLEEIGLSLDANGLLWGVPTGSASGTVAITATDTHRTTQSEDVRIRIP